MFKWSDRAEPRPNVRIHPLDAHALPQRLRGEVEEVRREQSVIVYVFAFFLVAGIVGTIVWAA